MLSNFCFHDVPEFFFRFHFINAVVAFAIEDLVPSIDLETIKPAAVSFNAYMSAEDTAKPSLFRVFIFFQRPGAIKKLDFYKTGVLRIGLKETENKQEEQVNFHKYEDRLLTA